MIVYGAGLVNTLINKLPVEIHIPGYKFCGPGTKLEKRLARGDRGINPLDEACKQHDIAYHNYKDDLVQRHQADKILQKSAWQRVKASDASLGEKTAALAVAAAMKAKRKMGMGSRKRKTSNSMSTSTIGKSIHVATKYRREKKRFRSRRKTLGNSKSKRERGSLLIRGSGMKRNRNSKTKNKRIPKVSFNSGIVKRISKAINNEDVAYSGGEGKLKRLIGKVVGAAKRVIKRVGGKKNIQIPRTIELPKQGGILPLIPIITALGALGGIAGGIGNIVKAVKNTEYAKKQYDEGMRHNKTMEAIALGAKKTGSALYLRPYRKGYALFLKPYSKMSSKN